MGGGDSCRTDSKLRLLYERKADGYILPEVAVETSDGTKTIDVAWISAGTYERGIDKDAFERAPEICIEVVSPANSGAEMKRTTNLYLERGAIEVWICHSDGQIDFQNADGKLDASKLCPIFPQTVNVRGRK
ncbi:MAG: Uma2 family endonuclease [Verrucomicrobia bacterium]|nr:Uma2 family endonuclease [Verrucomicrobiota bacterium]